MEANQSMYFDANRTMSRQRLFNFVLGARGYGKTYGFKKHVIKNFIRRGEQFVYIRRYETELPAAEMKNFFDDVAVEFPDHDFKAGKGLLMIDGQVAGWYIALSKATMLKSIPFPNVTLIGFDEFIIEVGMHQYLPNEVRTFLECYSTISRDRDVPVLFLSNAISMNNPYFLYFDVKFENEQTVYLTEFISVEITRNKAFERHMSNTKFGRMIANTDYGKYAVQNKFLLDTDTFIEPMPPGCGYIATIVFSGKECGYYIAPECNKWYLSQNVDSTCKSRFTLDITDHTEETILSARNNITIQSMINRFCQGSLRFDTQATKNLCHSTLKRLV